MKYLNFYEEFYEGISMKDVMLTKKEFLNLLNEYLLNDEFNSLCSELGCPVITASSLDNINSRVGYINLGKRKYFSYSPTIEGNSKMIDRICGTPDEGGEAVAVGDYTIATDLVVRLETNKISNNCICTICFTVEYNNVKKLDLIWLDSFYPVLEVPPSTPITKEDIIAVVKKTCLEFKEKLNVKKKEALIFVKELEKEKIGQINIADNFKNVSIVKKYPNAWKKYIAIYGGEEALNVGAEMGNLGF